ncbi:hypothetical protein Emag_001484 [Eimeria magna]
MFLLLHSLVRFWPYTRCQTEAASTSALKLTATAVAAVLQHCLLLLLLLLEAAEAPSLQKNPLHPVEAASAVAAAATAAAAAAAAPAAVKMEAQGLQQQQQGQEEGWQQPVQQEVCQQQHEQSVAAAGGDSSSTAPEAAVYCCRCCRRRLFYESQVQPHEPKGPPQRPPTQKTAPPSCYGAPLKMCTSTFVEPMEWMEGLEEQQGKLLCPNPSVRLAAAAAAAAALVTAAAAAVILVAVVSWRHRTIYRLCLSGSRVHDIRESGLGVFEEAAAIAATAAATMAAAAAASTAAAAAATAARSDVCFPAGAPLEGGSPRHRTRRPRQASLSPFLTRDTRPPGGAP